MEISQNTEKSPVVLRRLVTQTLVRNHQLTLVGKTLKREQIILIIIIIKIWWNCYRRKWSRCLTTRHLPFSIGQDTNTSLLSPSMDKSKNKMGFLVMVGHPVWEKDNAKFKLQIKMPDLCWVSPTFSAKWAVPSAIYGSCGDQSGKDMPTRQTRRAVPIVEVYPYSITNPMFLLLTVSLL